MSVKEFGGPTERIWVARLSLASPPKKKNANMVVLSLVVENLFLGGVWSVLAENNKLLDFSSGQSEARNRTLICTNSIASIAGHERFWGPVFSGSLPVLQ